MLLQDFQDWLDENGACTCHLEESEHTALFNEFLDATSLHPEKKVLDTIKMLAKEIYEIQLCVEGLMEDMEQLNE